MHVSPFLCIMSTIRGFIYTFNYDHQRYSRKRKRPRSDPYMVIKVTKCCGLSWHKLDPLLFKALALNVGSAYLVHRAAHINMIEEK